jgi:hypothetical protein
MDTMTATMTAPVEPSATAQMAWVGPIPADITPRLMPLSDVVEYRAEAGYVAARVGEGDCPWGCGNHGAAEAGKRGFCPNPFCAGPVLGVIR